jgi:hypothetical protein
LQAAGGRLQAAGGSVEAAVHSQPLQKKWPTTEWIPPSASSHWVHRILPAACRLPSAFCRLPAAACRLFPAACLLLSAFWILPAEIIDRIAISVGNQIITESQIDEEIRLTAFLNQEKLDLDNAERKKAAARLIEQTLVRREMEFSHYPLPPLSDAARSLETLKTRDKTEAEYQQELDAYGITEEGLKRRLWWQATFLRFIDYRFRPGIQIPDADVQASYQKQLDKWKQDGIQPLPSLEDVRASIEQNLTEQRIDQELDRWLADTRTQVAIRFHDEALQ